MSKLLEIDTFRKTVLLRDDFDVPLEQGQVADDFRIIASLPTINHLLSQEATVIILSHLGRPGGKYIPGLSLRPVAEVLAHLLPNVRIHFTEEVIGLDVRKHIVRLRPGEILFLGNIRFQEEEEVDNPLFAAELAKLGDIYINDAFAAAHRAHASIRAITEYLPSYPGLLLESELVHLQKLIHHHKSPYVAIIGGAKIKSKLPVLESLLPKVDKLLLGGAIANTFLRASGERVGQSILELSELYLAEDLLAAYPDKIVLPTDWVKDSDDPQFFRIMDIGGDTVNQFQEIIKTAKTIFWNGDLGVAEKEEFAHGTKKIAAAIIDNHEAYSLAAGGDTIRAIRKWNLEHGFDFISTGGGATLVYLAGETLPGLKALGLQ